jgi:hypothetical protein
MLPATSITFIVTIEEDDVFLSFTARNGLYEPDLLTLQLLLHPPRLFIFLRRIDVDKHHVVRVIAGKKVNVDDTDLVEQAGDLQTARARSRYA